MREVGNRPLPVVGLAGWPWDKLFCRCWICLHLCNEDIRLDDSQGAFQLWLLLEAVSSPSPKVFKQRVGVTG